MTPAEIQSILAQHYCTEGYHFNSLTKAAGIVYSDGVKAVADMCESWWLIDAICSHQKRAMQDPMLRDMQFWTLTVKDGKAVLKCERDSDDIAITQKIAMTDFPLPEIKIWLERGWSSFGDGNEREVMVAMLPSER